MKFIFADSLDYVDPNYDFEEDRFAPNREAYWDDQFPHEILGRTPYDGILVSRALIGSHRTSGRYTASQAMRFRLVGAREFLRFKEEDYPGSVVFGDSGAFAYHKLEVPPYSPEDMVDFYGDGQFTHGCSVDHIIFDFFEDDTIPEDAIDRMEDNKRRLEITLENAAEFLRCSKRLTNNFVPLGVVQGWSPGSMADAALSLKRMGYSYLAVGGMVPLRSPQIKKALSAIRQTIGPEIPIHILGFAKADEIGEFTEFGIASFDTTSPLIRAFKDSQRNYYAVKPEGGLQYFSAIRVPQSIENNQLKSLSKEGVYSQEDLQQRETQALKALREFDKGDTDIQGTLDAVMAYSEPLTVGRDQGHTAREQKKLDTLRERYAITLKAKPWKNCTCAVCRSAGIDVIIFRASNRNKRRGIHNLQAYRQHIDTVREMTQDG